MRRLMAVALVTTAFGVCGPRAESQRGRIHALRAAGAGDVDLQDHLRPDGGHAGSEVLLQRDPTARRHRRVRHRPDDRRAAEVQEVTGAEARESGLTDAEPRGPLPPGRARAAGAGRRGRSASASTRPTRMPDLPPRRQRDRVQSPAHRQARRRRPPGGLRDRLVRTFPSQVIEEADGRIAASLMNIYPGPAPLVLRASRAREPAPTPAAPAAPRPRARRRRPTRARRSPPLNQVRVTERAIQDREIVYFLKQPETHAFSLYHDYTASREGSDKYVNVVRAGSTVSEPSAKILDTGEALKTDTLTGADVTARRSTSAKPCSPTREVVVIPFAPVKKGQSVRLRIEETYTDPRALRSRRRPADVAPQLRPSAQRHGPAGGLVSDDELDSRRDHARGRRPRPALVRESETGQHRRLREGTAEIMLKGTRTALIKKIQPVSIHGQISLDVYFVDPDDPQGQVSLARLGAEAMPRHLEPGDRRGFALPGGRRDFDHESVRIGPTPAPRLPCFPPSAIAHWMSPPAA